MKKILSLMFATVAFCAVSCSEIEDGTPPDFDKWAHEKDPEVFEPQTYRLNHPCMLNSQADIDYVKQHVTESPWAEAYAQLCSSSFADEKYNPSPVEYLARMDNSNWGTFNDRWKNSDLADKWYEGIHNNYVNFYRDCAAAYQNALRYVVSGDGSYARTTIKIANAWAAKNKGLLLYGNGSMPDPNEILILFQVHQMANACELVRGYENWGKSDEFKKVANWMKDAFLKHCRSFLDGQGGKHYWLNWDLACMTGELGIGILCDDQDAINHAILYFKQGAGPGNILGQGVIDMFEDPSGTGEMLAQGNESGRDQGHNTLCAALMGTFCQMALNIGEDLFAFKDGRAIAFAQYVAKYNCVLPELGNDYNSDNLTDASFCWRENTMPFTPYEYSGGSMTKISAAGRGTRRPGWDIWAGYCKSHGVKATYISKMAERNRPDGGGGNYGGNSGGFDQLGFSTLMNYRP